MKKKHAVTYLLLLVSLIMLAVPVVPHHHHASNEQICMKNDVEADCAGHHSHHPPHEHCCCQTGCVTTHFVPRLPDSLAGQTDFILVWVAIVFHEFVFRQLTEADEQADKREPAYRESLHGTFIARATGLRAPPCVLA